MAEYVTAKRLVIPKGTRLCYPAPPQKEAVTYAHARLDADADQPSVIDMHWSIPLDEALKAGFIEEVD